MRLALIPARGGSKRIQRKNIREFLGKPVIAYAIGAAIRSGLFERILVSTDDPEIAKVASCFGVETPFSRPAELSGDDVTTDAVLVHAVEEAQRLYGPLDPSCCIYPVNPLLTAEVLLAGLDLLVEHRAPSSFPVVRYDFPIEQALELNDGVHPRFRQPELVEARSQDLPVSYHDAGMFYWFDPAALLAGGRLFCDDSVAFEIPAERCQDVNTPEDWAVAELKYKRLEAAGEFR